MVPILIFMVLALAVATGVLYWTKAREDEARQEQSRHDEARHDEARQESSDRAR